MAELRISDYDESRLDQPLVTRLRSLEVEHRPLHTFSITDIINAQDLCIRRPEPCPDVEPV